MKKIIPLFLGFLLVTGSVNAGVGKGLLHLISLGHKSSLFIDWFEDKRLDKPTFQQLQEEYRSRPPILKPKGK